MIELLTIKIPRFISWHDLNEHKYLAWPLVISMFAIFGLLSLLDVPGPYAVMASLFFPLMYCVYVIFALIKNEDFPFKVTKLGLNEQDEKFVKGTTGVFRERIVFYLYKMTIERTCGMTLLEKTAFIDRLHNAIHSRDNRGVRVYMGEIHIMCGYLHKIDLTKVDIEFVRLFMEKINPILRAEDLQALEQIKLLKLNNNTSDE